MILPEQDGTFTAACDRAGCSFSFNLAGEDLAKLMDTQHAEGHIERDLLADSIARAAAFAGMNTDTHQHGPQCTEESCPGAIYFCGAPRCVREDERGRMRLECHGHPVPTRTELVGRR